MAGRGGIPDLASGPNRDFYEALGIPRTADNEAIRKAYRRQALRSHPDKVGHDSDSVERFQLIQKAYEVLSDEKKRKVFDRYGERGITLMESMGSVAPFIDPDFLMALNSVFFVLTLLMSLCIMFPAFISARADGKTTWKWSVVFIPMFIIDSFIICALWSIRGAGSSKDDAEEDEGGFSEDRNEAHERRQRQKRRKQMQRSTHSFIRFGLFALFLTWQIFIVLRLDETITWNWFVVFIPWFVIEFVNVVSMLQAYFAVLKVGNLTMVPEDPEENPEPVGRPFTLMEKIVLFLDEFATWVLRIAQVILLCYKFNGSTTASWALIFLPTWLWAVSHIVLIILQHFTIRKMARMAGKAVDARALLLSKLIAVLITSFFLYLGVGLLVKRLDGTSGSPSTAVILIPVFIIFSLLFCCVCCCGPCLVVSARHTLEAELNGSDDVPIGEIVDSSKRITYSEPSSSTTQLTANT
ncbi:hypothetical protein DFS34DRAFT_613831 [Phlyctochytrium arcticum]|nr:hypothetical protein DFS34DRAFT_613831 [Phlyctochytrium arcticum]